MGSAGNQIDRIYDQYGRDDSGSGITEVGESLPKLGEGMVFGISHC